MNIPAVDPANNVQIDAKKQSPDALRHAAMQFEALLLTKLTAALNDTSLNEDEDALFGSDGGTGLAKQMFSEQLATTMAQSGGVGLSDIILKQFGNDPSKASPGGIKGLNDAMSAVKDIRDDDLIQELGLKDIPSSMDKGSAIGRRPSSGNPREAEIVSTFDEQVRADRNEETLRNMKLNDRAQIIYTTPTAAAADVRPDPSVVPAESRLGSPKANTNFKMPVAGRISSAFGNRFHPIDKKVKFHGGIDIAVPTGTRVDAAAGGVVKFAGPDSGYGNLVVIEHPDGTETRYGHLSQVLVSESDEVYAGQMIVRSGSTGKSTGPHVHFEVRENGRLVNPLKVLSNVLP